MITQRENLQIQDRSLSKKARQMHKAVFGLVGIWLIFTVTLLVATWRVGQSGKYSNSHLNSWTLEGRNFSTVQSKSSK